MNQPKSQILIPTDFSPEKTILHLLFVSSFLTSVGNGGNSLLTSIDIVMSDIIANLPQLIIWGEVIVDSK